MESPTKHRPGAGRGGHRRDGDVAVAATERDEVAGSLGGDEFGSTSVRHSYQQHRVQRDRFLRRLG